MTIAALALPMSADLGGLFSLCLLIQFVYCFAETNVIRGECEPVEVVS